LKLLVATLSVLVLALTANAGQGRTGGFRDGDAHRGGGFHGGGEHHGGGHWGGGGVWAPYPSYPSYVHGCGWDGYYCHDTYVGAVACAPEMVEGNVAATDRTLTKLAATSAFASAKTFKSELAQVAAMKDAGEKAQAYLQLAGIDSTDKAAIATFVGSRDAKGAWITDLQRNADLTTAQAETVAASLQTALRGNLQ
jgi:hypothetical protein